MRTSPGAFDALTDVAGVRVGQVTRDEPGWLTGVTVVVPPPGTVAGVSVRGGGPGTRETDLLDPRNLVDAVDAVVLSGGSAFGLATADGVAQAAYAAGAGWPLHQRASASEDEDAARVPIVPAAILFDLGRGGAWLHHPSAEDGSAAYAAAASGPIEQGSVGAGTGAKAGGLRGGLGTASEVLPDGTTVAALVVCNAAGFPVAVDGSLLGAGALPAGEAGGIPAPDPERAATYWELAKAAQEEMRAGTATTLAVVATDAALTKAGCAKLADTAHDGFARALDPVHTAYDGDTIFALATGEREAPTGIGLLYLQAAAARCVTRSIVRGLLAATTADRTADGGLLIPAWRDVFPS